MDKHLHFENAIFCLSNCNFLRFSTHNLSLLLIFYSFIFLIMYLQLSKPPTLQLQLYKKPFDIKSSVQCLVFCLFPQSSKLCLNGLYMEGVFHFKSWFLNA